MRTLGFQDIHGGEAELPHGIIVNGHNGALQNLGAFTPPGQTLKFPSHEHLNGVAACISTGSLHIGASPPVMMGETLMLAIEKQQDVKEGASNLFRDQLWVDRRSVYIPNSVVMRIK